MRNVLIFFGALCLIGFIAFPFFAGAREPLGHAPNPAGTCRRNLRQISMALTMYSQDFDERLPPHAAMNRDGSYTPLPYLLHPYLKNVILWRCPADKREAASLDDTERDTEVSYGYNWHALSPERRGIRSDQVIDAAGTVAFAESYSYLATPGPAGGTGVAARHSGRAMVAWLDGRVKEMAPMDLLATATMERETPLKAGIDSYVWWNLK